MSRFRREVPRLEAVWRGLSDEDVEDLQEALDEFDGSYWDLMDCLEDLGASRRVYSAVNAVAKRILGKSRGDVDLWDPDEMNQWSQGYRLTREELSTINRIDVLTAQEAANRGFSN